VRGELRQLGIGTLHRAREGSAMKEKITLVFDTLLLLSFQLVFRAIHEARRWNY
jgi:hypothetical protein